MSPLAEAIYRILADRANLRQPPMTYSELVKTLRPVDVSHGDLTRDDPRLFEALGEVGAACHDRGLPTLTALVVRGADGAPGAGYYHMFHPEAGNDPSRRREAWERELERVTTADFPPSLLQETSARQPEPTHDRHGSRQLGVLRIAEGLTETGDGFRRPLHVLVLHAVLRD